MNDMAGKQAEHMAARPSRSAGEVAAVAQDCYAGIAPTRKVRSGVEALAAHAVFRAGRWVGRALVAAAVVAAVMWAEAAEPERIDVEGAMRHIVSASEGEAREATVRDCVRGAALDVACARRVVFGYDLGERHGQPTAKR